MCMKVDVHTVGLLYMITIYRREECGMSSTVKCKTCDRDSRTTTIVVGRCEWCRLYDVDISEVLIDRVFAVSRASSDLSSDDVHEDVREKPKLRLFTYTSWYPTYFG